jgi:hypothetical protein
MFWHDIHTNLALLKIYLCHRGDSAWGLFALSRARRTKTWRETTNGIRPLRGNVLGYEPTDHYFNTFNNHVEIRFSNVSNVAYRLVWGYTIVSTDSKIIVYPWKWWRGTVLCPQDFFSFFKVFLVFFSF